MMKMWKWSIQIIEGLLLGAIHKLNPHQESLGGYGRFREPYPAKYITSSRNFREKDSGMPNGSNKILGKRRIYRRPYPVVVESGTNSLFGLLPRGENRGLIPCAIGKTVVA